MREGERRSRGGVGVWERVKIGRIEGKKKRRLRGKRKGKEGWREIGVGERRGKRGKE